ncbi:MAG: RimK/LysX family protein, partial [Candidatus Caldatribacteriota bacterium]
MRYLSVLILLLSMSANAQLLKEKILIGRVEWITLPDLSIKHKSRIDTGAKTSSLHATGIEEVQQGGELFVKFQSVDFEGKPKELIRKVESMQRVANPGGGTSKRYVIREKVKLGPIEKEISINLNDRSKM